MKHRLSRLVVLTVLVAGLGVGPAATSAQAHTDACAGTGTMTTSTGLGLPVLTVNTASFVFRFTVGLCLSGDSPSLTGTVVGACGLATGAGTTSSGHDFTFLWTGDEMQFFGGVQGTLVVREDSTGGSCLSKTATRFFLSGTLFFTH